MPDPTVFLITRVTASTAVVARAEGAQNIKPDQPRADVMIVAMMTGFGLISMLVFPRRCLSLSKIQEHKSQASLFSGNCLINDSDFQRDFDYLD